ncbi:putative UPF0481 protein At3g02645 [Durio zibethinus]|uniref:UPF0481 protein At3g02645 n=1 Tax=Durio zibethinus TaxID=66656 RepID=A0A6P5WNY6_DURZI|nr:putative UPF0481 protein At3g02645 [Durio zibethinus]
MASSFGEAAINALANYVLDHLSRGNVIIVESEYRLFDHPSISYIGGPKIEAFCTLNEISASNIVVYINFLLLEMISTDSSQVGKGLGSRLLRSVVAIGFGLGCGAVSRTKESSKTEEIFHYKPPPPFQIKRGKVSCSFFASIVNPQQMEAKRNSKRIASAPPKLSSLQAEDKRNDVETSCKWTMGNQMHLVSSSDTLSSTTTTPPTQGKGVNEDHKAKIPRFEEAYHSSLLKVPHRLRQVNENAYEPQLISIGPYHRGKPHLKEMEVYKQRCLSMILNKNDKERVAKDLNIEQAQNCYSPSFVHKENIFKETMLRDGCFLVELLCGRANHIDPIFELEWVKNALFYDILLLENQLPFYVLDGLYHLIKDQTDGKDLASQAFSFLRNFLPGPKNWNKDRPIIKDTDNIKHLLGLVHDNWLPSPKGIMRHQAYYRLKEEEESEGNEGRQEKWKFTFCGVEKAKEQQGQGDEENGMNKGDHNCNYFKCKFICCAKERKNVRKGRVEWQSLRCATELNEAGIEFKKVEVDGNGKSTEENNVQSLFDINFSAAVMKIPTFVVDDCTDSLFRNLIAYELYREGSTYVIDYVTLTDNLINSDKDVKLLRLSGIIENMLGDDATVAKMINKIRDHVTLCGNSFYYEEIFAEVKKHCEKRRNTWRATLLHDYFYSPWALFSFLAALLVILITITQFIFSILSL